MPSTFAKEAGNAIKLSVVTLILIIMNNLYSRSTCYITIRSQEGPPEFMRPM